MTSTSTAGVKKRKIPLNLFVLFLICFTGHLALSEKMSCPQDNRAMSLCYYWIFLFCLYSKKRNLSISIKHKCLRLQKFKGSPRKVFNNYRVQSITSSGPKEESTPGFHKWSRTTIIILLCEETKNFPVLDPHCGRVLFVSNAVPNTRNHSVNLGQDTVFAKRDPVSVSSVLLSLQLYLHCARELVAMRMNLHQRMVSQFRGTKIYKTHQNKHKLRSYSRVQKKEDIDIDIDIWICIHIVTEW